MTVFQRNKSHGLIAWVVETGIPHFVFSSIAAVYGSPDGLEPVAENARLAPASPYGLIMRHYTLFGGGS